MDSSEFNVSEWVDSRMASLNSPSGWQPNAAGAMARLKLRQDDHLERTAAR